MENFVFALDIGTRSVVGILLKNTNEKVEFVDLECVEHQERAMLNGQIHNAPLVSNVINKVKTNLEKRNNIMLSKTSVAAAGRTLVTTKEFIEEEFSEEKFVSKKDITRLKLKCVHKAQQQLKNDAIENEYNNYYSVGYSVIRNFLDDVELGNLEGQKGKKIGVEIVAAFLPKMVLESLKYVVEDNDLILENLTLEPIAAINAIIPSTMRKLNLALVDIGAGTSDIAISSEGTINAYGMVPIAGDEITEKISEDYLLDFNEAERIKRLINFQQEIEYTDVLGFTNTLSKEEILSSIELTSSSFAEEIAKTILSLNGKPPQAVILIGGGSLTPDMNKKIALNLGLPENRVAVQKAKSISYIENLPMEYQGPEYITPIGIALTNRNDSNLGFIQITVNDQPVSVLNLGENTAFDGILSAGISTEKIYPRPGTAKTIKINGKVKIIPGSPAKPSEIYINGEKGNIDDPIQPEDVIKFIPGEDGKDAQININELLPESKDIIINFKEHNLPFEIMINGVETVNYDQELLDNSNISIRLIDSIGEVMGLLDKKYLETISFNISNDNNMRFKTLYKYDFYCNERKVDFKYILQEDDWIEAFPVAEESFKISNILIEELESLEKKYITVTMEGETIRLSVADFEIYHNNKPINPDNFINDGDSINIERTELKEPLLIDLFKEIEYTPKAPEGMTRVEVLLNNEKAEYTSPIKDGDTVSILWR